MQATHHERSGPVAAFGAIGAAFSALSVGLAAYASHGAEGDARARLMLAAVFAFGHGVALAALAPHAVRRVGAAALGAWCAGVVLFSGSLSAAALWQAPTTLAPTGGTLLIAGWLLFALHCLKR